MSINAVSANSIQKPGIKDAAVKKPEPKPISQQASIFGAGMQEKINAQQPKIDGITNKLGKLPDIFEYLA